MHSQRWIRIVPIALIMYTISYVDRTNISLALDPTISHMMRDLKMDDALKGRAAGIFFIGYVLLQIPGGFLATHWSARKLVAILLVFWGACAVGCGFARTYAQFEFMRFMLGVAESGVFPATLILLTHWFPRAERARANAFWNLCMPLAVAFSSPITGWLLGVFGWQTMLRIEGALPFIWLPIWLYFISDHPSDAKWISQEERESIETRLAAEAGERDRQGAGTSVFMQCLKSCLTPMVLVLILVYLLQSAAAYGIMTFLTEGLKGGPGRQSGLMYGILFAVPYIVTAGAMMLVSWRSDKSGNRRGYVALVYTISGVALIASVLVKPYSFWLSYVFLCLAVPGPFASLAPFWSIPAEILPRVALGAAMGLINALGSLGGFLGPDVVGILKKRTGGITVPFSVLGTCLIVAAALVFLLPATVKQIRGLEVKPAAGDA